MDTLPIYNINDLSVRKYVAASGLVKKAVELAKHARTGSVPVLEQRCLEMAISQFECIRYYKVVETKAIGIFKPISNLTPGLIPAAPSSTNLRVNGVIISDLFLFEDDRTVTSTRAAIAINNFTSAPDYSAEVIGDEVHIKAKDAGNTPNGYVISLGTIAVSVVYEFIHFFGGQQGVSEDDNVVTPQQLENIFSNIAEITNCGYAPLGTKYKTI